MQTNEENKQWLTDWKLSIYIPLLKKGDTKDCSSYRTIALFSQTYKLMLKVLKQKPLPYMEQEMLMFKFDSEKKEMLEIILQISFDYQRTSEEDQSI